MTPAFQIPFEIVPLLVNVPIVPKFSIPAPEVPENLPLLMNVVIMPPPSLKIPLSPDEIAPVTLLLNVVIVPLL